MSETYDGYPFEFEARAERAGHYIGRLREAWRSGGVVSYLLLGTWGLFPVSVQTVLHPRDGAGFRYWLYGEAVPRIFTSRELVVSEVLAVLAAILLVYLQVTFVILFYRRYGERVALWPLPFVTVGLIGNAAWFLGTQTADLAGFLIGLLPLVLMVAAQIYSEWCSDKFVFGSHEHGGVS